MCCIHVAGSWPGNFAIDGDIIAVAQARICFFLLQRKSNEAVRIGDIVSNTGRDDLFSLSLEFFDGILLEKSNHHCCFWNFDAHKESKRPTDKKDNLSKKLKRVQYQKS